MKMVLKNKSKNKRNKKSNSNKVNLITKIKNLKRYITIKNLNIFLITFLITSIIIGIIFFIMIDKTTQDEIIINIKDTFTLKDSYNYFSLLLNSLFENLSYTFLIWILGISIIGIIIIIILYFFNGFSIGFNISGIFNTYGLYNGFLALLSFLFPSKIIYIILIYFISFFAIKFSIQLFKHLFLKKDIDLKKAMKKYFNVLVLAVIITIVYSILEVFVSPFMVKIFTNVIK